MLKATQLRNRAEIWVWIFDSILWVLPNEMQKFPVFGSARVWGGGGRSQADEVTFSGEMLCSKGAQGAFSAFSVLPGSELEKSTQRAISHMISDSHRHKRLNPAKQAHTAPHLSSGDGNSPSTFPPSLSHKYINNAPPLKRKWNIIIAKLQTQFHKALSLGQAWACSGDNDGGVQNSGSTRGGDFRSWGRSMHAACEDTENGCLARSESSSKPASKRWL